VAFYGRLNRRALTAPVFGALALTGRGAGVRPPPGRGDATLAERQAQAFVDALKPHRPGKPVIAIVALNEGTEMTDFLLPHAVLQRAGVADVQSVAPRRGRVLLYPALQVEVAQDLASFDQAYPSGADYVIVPAMADDNNPAITAWLKQQADRGARILGVCAGALIVGRAGLLDGRRCTTHWYFRRILLKRHPSAVYVPHQRYVIDGSVATTTGVTASVPTMLALVEAIGGHEKAQALATELGVASWSLAHDQLAFRTHGQSSMELSPQQSGLLAPRALERRCVGWHGRHPSRVRGGRLVAHRPGQHRGRGFRSRGAPQRVGAPGAACCRRHSSLAVDVRTQADAAA
jgi:putative intracellular protease/amidase